MPPKKSSTPTKETVEKISPKKTQQTLDSKQLVADKPIQKTKSKQFNSEVNKATGKSSAHRWNLGDGKTPNKLTISNWNVNGIRSVIKKGQLRDYIKKLNPDIIGINQTKIDEAAYDSQPIVMPGYEAYWNFCKSSAGYSGVAVFSKIKPISIFEDLPQVEHSQQGRVLTLEFEKFYFITAYVPNAGQKLDRLEYRTKEYDVAFQNYLEELKKKKFVILTGDLNVCHREIDIAKAKGNQKTAGFTVQQRNNFTTFLEKGWIDTFRQFHPTEVKYSWWSMRTNGRARNIGWRLDYFVVPKEFLSHIKQSRINNEILGSDHCPVELQIQL